MADPASTVLESSATTQRQRTLLLVDDEESILSSLRRLLRPDGYRILTATSGDAGLELLAQNEVGVILSDQRMPGMTGVEFLRRVKTIYPQTVRMVLSGYTELQSITDAINEGAIYKFLTKPWEDGLLRANIEEAFRYRELTDENQKLHSEVQLANEELAQANAKLLDLLAEKERHLELSEMSLKVAQEIIQCLPFPVLGLDNEGMVVLANSEAQSVLSKEGALLGLLAGEVLSEPLAGLVNGKDGETMEWATEAQSWRVLVRHLGLQRTRESGRLLLFFSSRNEF